MARFELAALLIQLWVVPADPVHDVTLELAGHSGQDVDEAVRVGRDEVDWRVARAHLAHGRRDRKPPTTRVSRVSEMAAADEPEYDPAFPSLDGRQVGVERVTPCIVQALPVVLRGTGCLARLVVRELDFLESTVQLVPLDLIRDERGDQVVDVRSRGDEHRQRVLAVVVPAAPASRRLDRLPREDVSVKDGPKALWALAHDHVAAAADRRRQPPNRVQESTHVGLGLGSQWMQNRAHAEVRLNERFDLDVARALQHGGVGPYVKLDGMLAGPARPGRRFHPANIDGAPRPKPLSSLRLRDSRGRHLQNLDALREESECEALCS